MFVKNEGLERAARYLDESETLNGSICRYFALGCFLEF